MEGNGVSTEISVDPECLVELYKQALRDSTEKFVSLEQENLQMKQLLKDKESRLRELEEENRQLAEDKDYLIDEVGARNKEIVQRYETRQQRLEQQIQTMKEEIRSLKEQKTLLEREKCSLSDRVSRMEDLNCHLMEDIKLQRESLEREKSLRRENTRLTDNRITDVEIAQQQDRTSIQENLQSMLHLLQSLNLQAATNINPTAQSMPQYDQPYYSPMPIVPRHATGEHSNGTSQQNHGAPSASASQTQNAEEANGRPPLQYSTQMVYTQTTQWQLSIQPTGSQSSSLPPTTVRTRDSGISEGTFTNEQSFENEQSASVFLPNVIPTRTSVHQSPAAESHQSPTVRSLDAQQQLGRRAVQHMFNGTLGHHTDDDQEAFQAFPPENIDGNGPDADIRNLQKQTEKLTSRDDSEYEQT